MGQLDAVSGLKGLKKQYGTGALNTYDISTPMLSQVRKTFNLDGEAFEDYLPLSVGGGRGTTQAGIVPTSETWKMDKVTYGTIENLSSVKLKRTFKYQTKGNGAWFEGQGELIKRGVIQFRNNTERQVMGGTNSGALGSVEAATAVTDNGGGSYTFDLTPSTFVEANWEEGDLVNIGTGSVDQFRIADVIPDAVAEYANPTITVSRKTGNQIPVAGMSIFMQGSEGNDIFGARQILTATTGSLYGVPVSRRWKSFYVSNYGKGINCDLIDQMVLGVHRTCGEVPNLGVIPHTQWRLLKSTLEGLKMYETTTITPRFNVPKAQKGLMDQAKTGRLGFKAIVYDSPFGSIPFVISRFCKQSEIFLFNTEQMELKHMRGFGWHDDDGTVWMREAGKTNYEARYGGDMNLWLPPTFHAYADGMTTS